MKSMTGFGKNYAVYGQNNEIEIEFEIKSVNNKNFDFRISNSLDLSNTYSSFNFNTENEIKNFVMKYIKRGKVDLKILIKDNRKPAFTLNKDKLLSFYNLLKEIRDELNIKDDISLDIIFKSVFTKVSSENNLDFFTIEDSDNNLLNFENRDFNNFFFNTLEQALKNHEEMAKIEGNSLKDFFLDSIETIKKCCSLIQNSIPEHKEKLKQNLITTTKQLLCDDFNEEREKRILLETALYLERCDISEELIRINCHLQSLDRLFKNSNNEPCGKSINFVLQELQREANTISAKYNTTITFESILKVKEEIEKCREQIQNVE